MLGHVPVQEHRALDWRGVRGNLARRAECQDETIVTHRSSTSKQMVFSIVLVRRVKLTDQDNLEDHEYPNATVTVIQTRSSLAKSSVEVHQMLLRLVVWRHIGSALMRLPSRPQEYWILNRDTSREDVLHATCHPFGPNGVWRSKATVRGTRRLSDKMSLVLVEEDNMSSATSHAARDV